MDEAEIKKMEGEAKKEVDDAIEAAMNDDEPPLSELYTDITSDPVGTCTISFI